MALNAQRRSQLRKYLAGLRRRQQRAVAVFDIGTKAARVLVAPLQVPSEEWSRGTFYNDAVVANLGDDVGADWNLPLGSTALDDVAGFLREYRTFLLAEGLQAEHLVAVGTAIFRWLANSGEVVRHLATQTGLALRILPAAQESQLSQTALLATYQFGVRKPSEPFSHIVLLDQGGGSLEVSCTSADGVEIGIDSLDKFGSLYLKKRFLQLAGEAVGGASFSARMQAFLTEIDERIGQWGGLATLRGKPLLVYGMGSALAACIPRMNNFFMHNSLLTFEELEARLQEVVSAFSAREVGDVEAETASDEQDDSDNELSVLYGLPVFLGMLRYFHTQHIRFAGYGLRYGLYLRLFRDGAALDTLAS